MFLFLILATFPRGDNSELHTDLYILLQPQPVYILLALLCLPVVFTWARSGDPPTFRPVSRPSAVRRAVASALLFGDVECNPGPQSADQLTAEIRIGVLNCQLTTDKTALIHYVIGKHRLGKLLLSETWFNSAPTKHVRPFSTTSHLCLAVLFMYHDRSFPVEDPLAVAV